MYDKTVSEGSCNLCTEIVGIWFGCIDIVTEIVWIIKTIWFCRYGITLMLEVAQVRQQA